MAVSTGEGDGGVVAAPELREVRGGSVARVASVWRCGESAVTNHGVARHRARSAAEAGLLHRVVGVALLREPIANQVLLFVL